LSDGAIKQAVEASLRKDPRASRYAINVTVEDGVVILDGTVGYMKAKTAAGQDARDVVGVVWVDNELMVRPYMNLPRDADIEKGLQAALRWDPLLAGAPIEVAVLNHVAYLGGSVDSVEQRAEAEDVASRAKGVVLVRNHLRIGPGTSYFFYGQSYKDFETFGPPPPKSDAQIQHDIERAFFWSPFVDRADINVTVHDGLVTLTGTVGSWMGYGEADRDARKSGAVGVLNRLKVR
jgi:osmotically-inducible protein OsmY